MSAIRSASRAARAVLAALVLGGLAAALPAPARAQRPPLPGFADLVDHVAGAVVNVSTKKAAAAPQEDLQLPQLPPGSPFEDFFKDFMDRDKNKQPEQPQRNFSLGSGFIVDPRGYVVTNNHVIADADEIAVIMHDDTEIPAKLVGRDTATDLALLKIEGPQPFPFVEWADSDKVRVGDWMVAIGNPFGLGSTVTSGIVSALNRDIRAGPYDSFIQVDAAINRGNSGGPSFDLDGKVFGINTAIFSPSGGNVGIGFAIPANLARPVIDSLMNSGKVARGWLGVRIQTVTDEIAESLGLKEIRGALVASVTPGGPAEQAGIAAGDVVLSFDGKPITKMRSLPRMVAETSVGKTTAVEVWRKGESRSYTVKLGTLPDDQQLAEAEAAPPPSANAKVEALGLTVAPVSDELRSQFSLPPDAKGVVVTEVAPGSPAADEDLKPGDLVMEVGQVEVTSPPDVSSRVDNARQGGKKSVLLLVNRAGDLRFVALKFKA